MQKLTFKHFIDEIVIDFKSSWNFASIEIIRKKCNTTIDMSKFSSNKKIFSDIILIKVTPSVTWIQLLYNNNNDM